MKLGYFFVSLAVTLLLLWCIIMISDPSNGQTRNPIALGFSGAIVVFNAVFLIPFCFKRTELHGKIVKNLGWPAVLAIVVLAAACRPNLEVKAVFTTISSNLALAPDR